MAQAFFGCLGLFGCIAGFVIAASAYLATNAVINPTDNPNAGLHVDANENVFLAVLVIGALLWGLYEIHHYKESVRKANEERERKRNQR